MVEYFKKTILESDAQFIEEWIFKKGIDFNIQQLCKAYFSINFNYKNFYLTKSCTQSLELALRILNFPKGSEIILPSFAFVSLGNAIVQSGFNCVFVDCEKDTMNISPQTIENAIGPKTVAVVTINYGSISCNYDEISPLCIEKNLVLIEDNAHGIRAKYNGKYLGNFGDISTISFDFMKNIGCNEGGGITINNNSFEHFFRIAYEFGTNKLDFLERKIDHYEWKNIGSNNTLAEPLAAILYNQLLNSESIIHEFRKRWDLYYQLLTPLEQSNKIKLAKIPANCETNGHMFWIKTSCREERSELISFLKSSGIQTAFHYTPLHSSTFGKVVGEFRGIDENTTTESHKLLRLPQYYSLTLNELEYVVSKIFDFYNHSFRP